MMCSNNITPQTKCRLFPPVKSILCIKKGFEKKFLRALQSGDEKRIQRFIKSGTVYSQSPILKCDVTISAITGNNYITIIK